VVCEYVYDDSLVGLLYPREEAAVARAVEKRRTEFRTTRTCARLALHRLGAPIAAIGVGPRGVPLWPDGVLDLVAVQSERPHLAALPASGGICWGGCCCAPRSRC